MKLVNIKSEGSLLSYDLLAEIYKGEAKGQKPVDFGIKGNITDEISASWSDVLSFWDSFQRSMRRLADNETSTKITRERFVIPLLETLGFKHIKYYTQIEEGKAETIDDKAFPISHRAGDTFETLPIHIHSAPKNDDDINNIDKRNPTSNLRLSPHSLVQEYLNRTDHLWGIVTNGYIFRILRNSARLSKPSYIEFDIKNIIESEDFSMYQLFYRLVHYSRWYTNIVDANECLLEQYYQQSIDEGGRVRDNLRDNVDRAIRTFANGFIKHPDNIELRENLESKNLSEIEYYRQLLKLIYRFLFLMVSEERNLVGPDIHTEKGKLQRLIYDKGYSISRLRSYIEKPINERENHYDIWEQVKITFELYSTKSIGEKLGIKYLNGDLFGMSAMEDLEQSKLYNSDFIKAFKQLSLFRDEKTKMLRRINYAHLDVEELGSVYESLLDFHPVVEKNRYQILEFKLVVGTERKSTGSYYTRPELVGELIKSALEPVIEDRLKDAQTQKEKINSILNIKVCDPAAGSGHFLLATARRLAKELAIVITQEESPTPSEFRKAIREVIKHCIYGVDLNPLAVDLCKVALWIEGHNFGEPLTFLDHRIKCGNSLIGLDRFERLTDGIPDDAFKPVTGDDKEVAKQIKALNRSERKDYESGQTLLDFKYEEVDEQLNELIQNHKQIDIMRDEKQKEIKYYEIHTGKKWLENKNLADIWTSAFFYPLNKDTKTELVPTYDKLMKYMTEKSAHGQMLGMCGAISSKHNFFHWELEFPEVFAKDGFDVVLGNPPWEKIKLEEKEFFSTREPNIANAPNASKRKKLINALPDTNTELYSEYEEAKHFADSYSIFVRDCCASR